ncbi:MAG: molybdopterin-dependent oxidoreductase, partial [Proteobacteria bacterium]|nr:molybdopterin-dependent oxidoreductase [Pseudomonadota bacterium]
MREFQLGSVDGGVTGHGGQRGAIPGLSPRARSSEIGLGEKFVGAQARLEVVADRDDAEVIGGVLVRQVVELGDDAGQIARGRAHPGVLEEAKLLGREFVLGSFFRRDDALASLVARHLDPAESQARRVPLRLLLVVGAHDLDGDVDSVKDRAAIQVSREIRTARQCMMPIEGRGVVAAWDGRREQLVVHSAAQMPHVTRTGLSECLGLDHGQVRVIAPDVGGGFGYKGILLPEEVCLSWLTMHLGHPVRWIEDRREHLSATANCREHHYRITAYAEADGRLLAIDAEATVDSGAYSIYPFTAGLEAAQIGSILPGPYDFPVYRCRTWSVASNKPPILPYRGVARTGVCFAMELMLDAVAREAGLEPHEVRLKNLVPPEAMPFDNITGKHFDSGDYPECLRRAVAAIDLAAVRERQARGAPDGRPVGVGFAVYCEQAAHGTSVYAAWGMPMVPGHEQASARITPDGGLELRLGVHSHGQGLETTLAQVAHEVLGIDIDKVKLVLGDTEYTPYSTGTWGSRCMVMAGGAVAAACRELAERLAKIGAHLLQVPVAAVTVQDGKVQGASGSVGIAEVAQAWYLRPQDLPEDVDRGGLEVTAGYKPLRDSGTFSYAAHAVVVAVDIELGAVEILDYVVIEDGGRLVNPMIVDGQIRGGAAQS